MKIMLVNLPWYRNGLRGVRAGSRWPHLRGRHEWGYLPFPFFLAYAAALLKKHGFAAELLDAIAAEMSDSVCVEYINNKKPDLLVCETSTVTLKHDLELLKKIDSGIPIALCGPDINIRQPDSLKNHAFINYVLTGEYEFTLLELAEKLKDKKRLDGVLGLIYRDGVDIKGNPFRPLSDINHLPWPLREGLPMSRYNDSPGDIPLPSVQMMASRGCPYGCKFCLWPQIMYQGNSYRVRDIVDVADEMEHLVKEKHFKSVYFDDDTFNCGKERMLRLSAEIKSRRLGVPWAIMARPDLMDEDILRHMKSAGLYAVKYGVESAVQSLLDGVNKKMDIRKAEEMIKLTKRLGIKAHLTFTFGLPGETKESIERTIDLALNLDPTSVQFSIATPFPGTSFYEEMEHNGLIISRDWSEYDGNHKSVICYDGLSKKDLEDSLLKAYRRWAGHCAKKSYLEPGISWKQHLRMFADRLRRHGIIGTFSRGARILVQTYSLMVVDALDTVRKIFRKDRLEKRLNIGRLTLVFDTAGLRFYWDGTELTRGEGLMSHLGVASGDNGVPCFAEPVFCDCQAIDGNKFIVKRRWGAWPLEENWRIEIIDEKQVDWEVDIEVKNDIVISEAKVGLLLSGKYKRWLDSWGAGGFYPINEHRGVILKNPGTDFIGVKGRKRINGQLPTVLLDLSGDADGFAPAIRNSPARPGARLLEINMQGFKKGRHAPGTYSFFAGRIKIVEDDFYAQQS